MYIPNQNIYSIQIFGKIQISRLLFMARANPTIEDIQERTPIYLAAERGHTHVVDFLADKFKVIEIPFY